MSLQEDLAFLTTSRAAASLVPQRKYVVEQAIANDAIESAVLGNRRVVRIEDLLRWSKAHSEEYIDGRVPKIRADLVKAVQKYDIGKFVPRTCEIMRLRFGIDGTPFHTLAWIGDRFSISRERVRQIIKGACDRIRLEGYMEEEE